VNLLTNINFLLGTLNGMLLIGVPASAALLWNMRDARHDLEQAQSAARLSEVNVKAATGLLAIVEGHAGKRVAR
jgi:hypothetical protein